MYWIINDETKEYVTVEECSFDADWRKEFPHVANTPWSRITTLHPHSSDVTRNGVPYAYDLCCSGGLFHLLVDQDEHDDETVRAAIDDLYHSRDVAGISILQLRRAQ